MASNSTLAILRSGRCRPQSPPSSSTPRASSGSSAACNARRCATQSKRRPMLRIEYVYWLCGVLLLAAGVFEFRDRRVAQAAFWTILAACFFGGDAVLDADRAGNTLPAQVSGL